MKRFAAVESDSTNYRAMLWLAKLRIGRLHSPIELARS